MIGLFFFLTFSQLEKTYLKNLQDTQQYLNKNYSFITSKMNSINLFPVEEKQTLRTEKLKVNFRFNSYNSYLELKNNSKELQIYFDSKVIQNQILENIKGLSASYSHDVEYTEELFKIIVSKIDKMPEEKQDELAKYFVENINKEVKK